MLQEAQISVLKESPCNIVSLIKKFQLLERLKFLFIR